MSKNVAIDRRDEKLVGWVSDAQLATESNLVKLELNGEEIIAFTPKRKMKSPDSSVAVKGFVLDLPSLLKIGALYKNLLTTDAITLNLIGGLSQAALIPEPIELSSELVTDFIYNEQSWKKIEFTVVARDYLAGRLWLDSAVPRSELKESFGFYVKGSYVADAKIGELLQDGSYSFRVELMNLAETIAQGDIAFISSYQTGVVIGLDRVPDFALLSALKFDRMIGRFVMGWGVHYGESKRTIPLALKSMDIGWLQSDQARPDVASVHQLQNDRVGFHADLGGVIHFLASISEPDLLEMSIRDSRLKTPVNVNFAEAVTFAPMRLTLENREDEFPFHLISLRCHGNSTIDMELAQPDAKSGISFKLMLIQQTKEGALVCSEQLEIDGAAASVRVRADIEDLNRPLLMVITSMNDGKYIISDCIPMPALAHEENFPLLEMHSLFARGQPRLPVLRKLQKNWFDYLVRSSAPELFSRETSKSLRATQSNTAVLVFSRDEHASELSSLNLSNYSNLGSAVLVIQGQTIIAQYPVPNPSKRRGSRNTQRGSALSLVETLLELDCEYVAFVERSAVVRPDVWSILSTSTTDENSDWITGNVITYDGSFRPSYISHMPLQGLDNLVGEPLIPINFAIAKKTAAIAQMKELEEISKPFPEHLLLLYKGQLLEHIRLPLYFCRETPFVEKELEFLDEHAKQWSTPAAAEISKKGKGRQQKSAASRSGISVILNFRNHAETTKNALTALKLQGFDGSLEVILVDNASTPDQSAAVLNHAIELFGETNTHLLSYPHAFNHSEQTNLAAQKATQPLLLMLSNDAMMLTPGSLDRASALMKDPRIGTCGFRVIRPAGIQKWKLESLGLRFAFGRLAAMGGSILERNIVPHRFFDCAMRVAGTTFAASLVRKDVFLEVGEMDVQSFPTSFNDVDFCLRASAKGYMHVALGQYIVQHSGRGSREPDLDFPTPPQLLKAFGNADDLAQTYTSYSFGDIRTY